MSAPQARRQDYDYLIKLLLIGDSGESMAELLSICGLVRGCDLVLSAMGLDAMQSRVDDLCHRAVGRFFGFEDSRSSLL